jgi:hypothetical protein
MAIDKTTGKRKRVAAKDPKEKKKVPKYETDYENALKRQLFEDDTKKKENEQGSSEDEIGFYEETRQFYHHKREGE